MTRPSTNSSSRSSLKTFLWIATGSTALAVIDHFYLLSEHYRLRFGDASGKSLCDISDAFSCAAVSASRYSEFLGVPMAMWGAAANVVLLLLLAWYPFTEDEKKPAARRNLLLVSVFIALTSIVMGAISSFVLARFCPFCLVAYALSFISFGAIWLGLRNAGKPAKASTALAQKSFSFSDLSPVLILGGIALVGSFIANDQVRKSYGFRDMGPFVQEKVVEWETSQQVQIPVVDPLVKGASADQAKMTITEFADFRCIHCKNAAPVLKAFVSAHPDVRLQFQVWPLDGECNTSISRANGASCLLARTVYCAEKSGEGRGWAAHDYIFANLDRWVSVDSIKGAFGEIAQASGMPAEQLATCSDAQETKDAVQKQAAVGTGLNLQGTPTIYVNGKKVQAGQSLPVLSAIHARLTAK